MSRNDSCLSRLSRSPYTQQQDVRLREDSQGNIEGVEYLAGSSGYDSEDDSDYYSRKASVGSVCSRRSQRRQSSGESRRSSQASTYRPRPSDRSQTFPKSSSNSLSGSIRLCPSPGHRPSARFTLSSPETSGKDDPTEDEDDIPKLVLPECYITRPKPSIGKSPLLNRDLLRFVKDAGAGDAVELEPMMFALSMSEDEGHGKCVESTRRGSAQQAVSPKTRAATYPDSEEDLRPLSEGSELQDRKE